MKRSFNGYFNYGAPAYMGPQMHQAQYQALPQQQLYQQQQQQQQPYFYPGPPQPLIHQQQQPLQQAACHYAPIPQAFAIPTFEQLIKNRILNEKRFYLSNSNSKWLSLGITPTTKILDEASEGFQTEVFLCGEKGNISLGGIDGAAALFKSFRAMQQFAPMYTNQKFDFKGLVAENIVITKANFGNEVYKIINTRAPEKSGWLAATSVQVLLSLEAIFMTVATSFDASKIEMKFNSMIEKGVSSVVDMETCVLAGGDPFELELIANFKDFVYLCVDVKKKNAVEQQQQQQQQALPTPAVQFSPPPQQQQHDLPQQQQQQLDPLLLQQAQVPQQQQQQQPTPLQQQQQQQQAAEKIAKRPRKQ